MAKQNNSQYVDSAKELKACAFACITDKAAPEDLAEQIFHHAMLCRELNPKASPHGIKLAWNAHLMHSDGKLVKTESPNACYERLARIVNEQRAQKNAQPIPSEARPVFDTLKANKRIDITARGWAGYPGSFGRGANAQSAKTQTLDDAI